MKSPRDISPQHVPSLSVKMAQCGCNYYFIAPLILAFVFSDGAKDLQLVGGSLPNEGRIELLLRGVQHNICSNRTTWTAAKSEVMCRQMGYAGHVMEKYDAYFGEGNWTIIHDPLNCTGDEEHISDCPPWNDTIKCTHRQDMAIICQLPGYLGCYSNDMNVSGQVTRRANISLTSVTPFNCIVACWKINMSYAIVTHTGCQCMDTLVLGYDEAGGDSDKCVVPCPDTSLYFCGGVGNVDVYKTVDLICHDPGIPVNGYRHGNRFYFGDEVLFSCQEGYILVGASKTECTVSSNNAVEWDSAVPICNLDLEYQQTDQAPFTDFSYGATHFTTELVTESDLFQVTDPATEISSTEYPEVSFQSPTIVENLQSSQASLTDINDRTINLTTSSDVTIWGKTTNSTTKPLEHVISLTSLWELPLSKNDGTVTSITETPTPIGGTKETNSSNQPVSQSSTQKNPITSEAILNVPTDKGWTTPKPSLTQLVDPQMVTEPDGKETIFTSSIITMYYTSTVSEGLVTDGDLIQGDSIFRLFLTLGISVIILVVLFLIALVIICCLWCRKDKPVFRVASSTESDVRSSFVFKRVSDSYKRFDQQRSSGEAAKPDVVTMGTTFGHDDTDASMYHQNPVFVEPGYEQTTEHKSETNLSHSEAVKMFRESKGNMYNQFDFEVPRENEITEEEDLQFPSSFLEDDFMKQSTV